VSRSAGYNRGRIDLHGGEPSQRTTLPKITGRINGRFEVCLLRKRFNRRDFFLITLQSVFSSWLDARRSAESPSRAGRGFPRRFRRQEAARDDFRRYPPFFPVCLLMAMMGTTTPSSERWPTVSYHYIFDFLSEAENPRIRARCDRFALCARCRRG